jgi:hypothetical protein
VPFSGYVAMAIYAMYVHILTSLKTWLKGLIRAFRGLVISQAQKGGFRFRNVNELEQLHADTAEESPYSVTEKQLYDNKNGEAEMFGQEKIDKRGSVELM